MPHRGKVVPTVGREPELSPVTGGTAITITGNGFVSAAGVVSGPVHVDDIPTMGWFSRMEPVEPWKTASP